MTESAATPAPAAPAPPAATGRGGVVGYKTLTRTASSIFNVASSVLVHRASVPDLRSLHQQHPSASVARREQQQQQLAPLSQHHQRDGSQQMVTAASSAGMSLAASCPSCGSHLDVKLPSWLTDRLDAAAAAADERAVCQHHVHDIHGQQQQGARYSRDAFIDLVVGAVLWIRHSPIPAIILAFVRLVFTTLIYLDARFGLHQKLALMLSTVLESAIVVEREVGLFRGIGETISVLWEASVKSTIAFAKADTAPPPPPPPAAAMAAPYMSSSNLYSGSFWASGGASATHHHTSTTPPSYAYTSTTSAQHRAARSSALARSINANSSPPLGSSATLPPAGAHPPSLNSSASSATSSSHAHHHSRRDSWSKRPLLLASSSSSSTVNAVPMSTSASSSSRRAQNASGGGGGGAGTWAHPSRATSPTLSPTLNQDSHLYPLPSPTAGGGPLHASHSTPASLACSPPGSAAAPPPTTHHSTAASIASSASSYFFGTSSAANSSASVSSRSSVAMPSTPRGDGEMMATPTGLGVGVPCQSSLSAHGSVHSSALEHRTSRRRSRSASGLSSANKRMSKDAAMLAALAAQQQEEEQATRGWAGRVVDAAVGRIRV